MDGQDGQDTNRSGWRSFILGILCIHVNFPCPPCSKNAAGYVIKSVVRSLHGGALWEHCCLCCYSPPHPIKKPISGRSKTCTGATSPPTKPTTWKCWHRCGPTTS